MMPGEDAIEVARDLLDSGDFTVTRFSDGTVQIAPGSASEPPALWETIPAGMQTAQAEDELYPPEPPEEEDEAPPF